MAVLNVTGWSARCEGFIKFQAMGCLPEAVVCSCMGWDRESVRWYRIYYRDGFVRAWYGKGFK
jgi:hypothetical protein